MRKQLFILGNPRSGTSLLRLILNSHSLVTIPPECGFLLWLFPKYHNWTSLDLNTELKNNFINDVLNSKKFETWKLTFNDLRETIDAESPSNYEALGQCVYLSYAYKYKKQPVVLGDKNNYYIENLNSLDQLHTNKLIVHIIRDGRDVAVSYKNIDKIPNTLKYKPKLPIAVQDIAKQWEINNMNIYSKYRKHDNYVLLRYEDLLRNTKESLGRVLGKCNLNFESNMLNFYKDNLKNEIEPKETLAWKMKTTQPIDSENIGIYKHELSTSEIDTFNGLVGKTLKRFGYEIEH